MSFMRFKPPHLRSRLLSSCLAVLDSVFVPISDLNKQAIGQTELLWDTYGVPHIYAQNSKGLFHAFGWAQMHSHGNLLLRLYGQARGRAAEYWGEDYLESDQWVRMMDVSARARQWYAAQTPRFRRYLDAFADGMNAYARQHPESIDDTFKVVLPVTAVDVLAHTQRVLNFTFIVNPEKVAGIIEQEEVVSEHVPGSNGWAIAPSHSKSGNAMLLANPHLYWSDLFLWYEAQLTAPGIDAYGAALVGTPVLEIAFNNSLGWTHTVNTHHGWTAYELELAEGGYRWNGKICDFKAKQQTLKIKQSDGTIQEKSFPVQHSIHGPVIHTPDGRAIAIRVVGLDQPRALEQWWKMARANNLSQFEAALKRLQIPMFTVLYADCAGHIMHLFNGRVPIRPHGDFKFWKELIPGNTSATLWTKTHPYRDLPKVVDPASGWVQNANDPPWTTTFPAPLKPTDYPPYIAPNGSMNFRAQRSARMLQENANLSFEDVIELKYSTRSELADRLLDDLILLAQQQEDELTRRAAEVLANWDRHTEPESRGAVLFAAWVQELDLSNFFATSWHLDSPLSTPNGIADPETAIAALTAAAQKIEADYGSLDVPWGKVFRIQHAGKDLPADGAEDPLGIFRNLWFVPTGDGQFTNIGGDSFIAVVEFSNPVKAKVLNTYGNLTQPNSPHQTDQLPFAIQKQLRPVWRSRQDIEAHLVSRQVF
ncbi:MAG: acylase [Myxacorys chilensis ATA2-1-KO14]|jgi:acyl-homoserine-lactone acylase|nr:acylase [Myxacorys chilensis ATA2-1-KO14]